MLRAYPLRLLAQSNIHLRHDDGGYFGCLRALDERNECSIDALNCLFFRRVCWGYVETDFFALFLEKHRYSSEALEVVPISLAVA